MGQPAPFTSNILQYVVAGLQSTDSCISEQNTCPISPLLAASYVPEPDRIDRSGPSAHYFQHELGVPRLNAVHSWLWIAGRPIPARALHHQKVMGREIVVTERMDMHLVWSKTRIFIKPLPHFLFHPSCWTDYLSCKSECTCGKSPVKCEQFQLRKCALGLLRSYAALVSRESDFFIAQEAHLLSHKIPWQAWKTFVQELLTHEPNYDHIDQRYIYGELRLNRLNMIYRLTGRSLRGYMPEYSQYSSFFQENFTWLASLLAYVVVVLTAMQVGLATSELEKNEAFQAACYGFTVLAIVGSLALVIGIFCVFLFLFVFNWIRTMKYVKKKQIEVVSRSTTGIA